MCVWGGGGEGGGSNNYTTLGSTFNDVYRTDIRDVYKTDKSSTQYTLLFMNNIYINIFTNGI